MSLVTLQLLDFFEFVIVGVVISILFDFFRAYRSARKINNFTVLIQDIIYFFLVTIIIIFSIINILDSNLRLYIFFAMVLGIITYISILSKFFLKLYNKFFKTISFVVDVIFSPIKLYIQILRKFYKFFKKNIKKCCKKFFYVLSLICNKLLNIRLKEFKIQKRRVKKYE